MASQSRDIRLDTLTRRGVLLPLGGDGVAARATFPETGSVTPGLSTTIKNVLINETAVITLTCFPEDPIHALLIAQYNAERVPGVAATKAPMVLRNGVTGEIASFGDSQLTQQADMLLAQATETVTWTISGIDPFREIITPEVV